MNATVLFDGTPIHYEMSRDSEIIATLKKDDVVAILDRSNLLWYKIAHNEYTGYVKSKLVKSEDDVSDNVYLCIPREAALALYEALSYVLRE